MGLTPETVTEVRGAARRLNCSTDWVRRLVDAGKLRALRTENGQRLIFVKDVERLRREDPPVNRSRRRKT
jgi:excisionase family DNA binding protein